MSANSALHSLLETVGESISDIQNVELTSQVDNQRCPHHFGYLADLSDNSCIPEECLLCSKVVKCILHL